MPTTNDFYIFVQLMPWYISKPKYLPPDVEVFRCMLVFFGVNNHVPPPRPKEPFTYVVYICDVISLKKDILGLGVEYI